MKEQRLKHKEDKREDQPHDSHQVDPPERQILVATPCVETFDHVEPGDASHERYAASLQREPALKRLEQPQALLTVWLPPKRRDQDGGDERYSANPHDDSDHVKDACQGQ
jgi:hypothetical protein